MGFKAFTRKIFANALMSTQNSFNCETLKLCFIFAFNSNAMVLEQILLSKKKEFIRMEKSTKIKKITLPC